MSDVDLAALSERLKRDRYSLDDARDAEERAYRRGWNDAMTHVGQIEEELAVKNLAAEIAHVGSKADYIAIRPEYVDAVLASGRDVIVIPSSPITCECPSTGPDDHNAYCPARGAK